MPSVDSQCEADRAAEEEALIANAEDAGYATIAANLAAENAVLSERLGQAERDVQRLHDAALEAEDERAAAMSLIYYLWVCVWPKWRPAMTVAEALAKYRQDSSHA